MPSEKRNKMDSNELYDRIAGVTGEDVETIASLGFNLYMFAHDETEMETAQAEAEHSVRA